MLGWLLTFALLSMCGFMLLLSDASGGAFLSIKVATAVFTVLFFVCLLTRIVRRHA